MVRNTETVLAELRDFYIGKELTTEAGEKGKVISVDYDAEIDMYYYRFTTAAGETYSTYESEVDFIA